MCDNDAVNQENAECDSICFPERDFKNLTKNYSC